MDKKYSSSYNPLISLSEYSLEQEPPALLFDALLVHSLFCLRANEGRTDVLPVLGLPWVDISLVGSQPNATLKTRIDTIPSQKSGIATAPAEKSCTSLVRCFTTVNGGQNAGRYGNNYCKNKRKQT